MAAAALVVGFLAGRQALASRLAQLLADHARVRDRLEEQRIAASQLQQRCQSAEELVSTLQRSVVEMPEIAQRLAATRDLSEIPDRTLDLVQEIFQPSYSVFYRSSRKDLVAVASRGESEFGVGHRLALGEGVVGRTAERQLAFTPEDARLENRALSGSAALDFSLCLPIVNGETTIGVVLIGPSGRSLPHNREIGRTLALIASVSIASAGVLKEQRLLAKTDGLTGLPNRTHLLDQVRELLVRERRERDRLSLFLFDVDHFKTYNDTNGHLAGDHLLQGLAALLCESIREGELVGRYGGEEFLLVMPKTDKADALRAAERIRGLIARHVFPFEAKQPGGDVTISGGVATWPHDGEELDTLIRHADDALYEAKREGRNRVLGWNAPELTDASADDAWLDGTALATRDPEKPEPD